MQQLLMLYEREAREIRERERQDWNTRLSVMFSHLNSVYDLLVNNGYSHEIRAIAEEMARIMENTFYEYAHGIGAILERYPYPRAVQVFHEKTMTEWHDWLILPLQQARQANARHLFDYVFSNPHMVALVKWMLEYELELIRLD